MAESYLKKSTTIQRVDLMILDDATFVKFQGVLDSVSKLSSPAKSTPVSVQIADSPQWSPALRRHSYSVTQTSMSSKDNSVLKEMSLHEMHMSSL